MGTEIERASTAEIAALDVASDEHAASLRPENTTRSYAGDWQVWKAYTADKGLPLTTATRGTLRGFVHWLWTERGAAPATIDRRLTGTVVTLRRAHRILVDPEDVKVARELAKDYQRQAAEQRQGERGRGKARPLSIADLRAIGAACPDTLAGVRDRALVLMAFSLGARRAEVAGLSVADVEFDQPRGLVVTVRVSKTKPRTVAIPYGYHTDTCPVHAWLAWLNASKITEGAAFRSVNRHGRLGESISGEHVGVAITRAGDRAGIHGLTGHSARAGLVTEARKAGHDAKTISDTTGHAPTGRALFGYMRDVDRWESNAHQGIGL